MIDLPNILKNYIESFQDEITIKSLSQDGDLYTANSKNKSYASTIRKAWISNEEIVINSIDEDIEFQFINSTPSEINKIVLDSFSFYHGTRMTVNNELIDAPQIEKQYFAWLQNGFKIDSSGESSFYNVSFTLYILEVYSPEWEYLDHHNQVMYPLSVYAENLVKSMDKNDIVLKINNYSIVEYADFGVLTRSGTVEKIFDEDLSGVELKVSCEMYKTLC